MGFVKQRGGVGPPFVLVWGLGAQHGVKDIDAAAGQADEGGVVFLGFGAFPVVVGAAERVGQGRERGQEERAFELLVAALGWVFAADADAGAAGDRGQPGVGGSPMTCSKKIRPVTDWSSIWVSENSACRMEISYR
jgi:hypothetical protein